MASLLGLENARRRHSDPGSGGSKASFGLVTELVERDHPGPSESEAASRAPMGVLRIGEHTTLCRVEHVPAVGDLIHGAVTGIVETVRIARNGRVSIVARPVPSLEA